MTDRVIEIRLIAPRPSLLALLAQPEMAVMRDSVGTGPFRLAPESGAKGVLRLKRADQRPRRRDKPERGTAAVGRQRAAGGQDFATGGSDLVLGGTLADLPLAQRARLPRGSLRFDPASGLFGLAPVRAGGRLDKPEVRRLLSAGDRSRRLRRRAWRSRAGAARDLARARARRHFRAGRARLVRNGDRGPPPDPRRRSQPPVRPKREADHPRRPSRRPGRRPPAPAAAARLGRDRTDGRARGQWDRRRLRPHRRGRAVSVPGLVRAPLPLRGGAGLRSANRRAARHRARPADPGRSAMP